jgi:hypothetical protein
LYARRPGTSKARKRGRESSTFSSCERGSTPFPAFNKSAATTPDPGADHRTMSFPAAS